MRIGLVSDTHIPAHVPELPFEKLAEVFNGVDMIMHGGDIYALSVLNDLERIAPVLAARGDDDWGATVLDKRVKDKHILKLGEQIVWLVHQRPFIPRMTPEWWASRNGAELAKPNIVIFGHEHRTIDETIDGVHYISSGSPTFLHYKQGPGTYGILDMDSAHSTLSTGSGQASSGQGNPSVQILNLKP